MYWLGYESLIILKYSIDSLLKHSYFLTNHFLSFKRVNNKNFNKLKGHNKVEKFITVNTSWNANHAN